MKKPDVSIVKNYARFFDTIKAVSIPLFLVVTVILILGLTLKSQNDSTKGAIYGLVFGIALGFGLDMFKRSFDEVANQLKLKKITKRILEQDARSVYRQAWLYNSLFENPNVPEQVKNEVKSQIPPEYKLRYWRRIKEDKDFLLLASDDWFHKIYNEFFDIEEINEQIALAKNGNKQSHQFAILFNNLFIKEKNHTKLLQEFIGKSGMDKFQAELEEKANNKQPEK